MTYLERMARALNLAIEQRDLAKSAIDAATDDISAEDLGSLERAFDAAQADVESRDAAYKDAEKREKGATDFQPIAVEPAVEGRSGSQVIVGDEPSTYNPGNQNERSFFMDMYAAEFGSDSSARERLARNRAENHVETRAAGTTANWAGLVIPQYLVDLYAPIARAGRHFTNECRALPLPSEGMVFNISRLTTGTSTATQTNQNDDASSTVADDTLLAVNVRTIAGQQDVSRQVLERGTPGLDQLYYEDMLADYATKLNVANVTAALATSGINAVTYTDASPTGGELYPKAADAIRQVQEGRFKGATHVFMTSRRFYWLASQLDTTGRPFVVPIANAPMAVEAYNTPGVLTSHEYDGPVGVWMGLPVFIDEVLPKTNGTGTNEDVIVIARMNDLLSWEEGDGTPRQARFEQTLAGSLTVKLVVYGYSAFTAGRYPTATSVISGTGLVAPTF